MEKKYVIMEWKHNDHDIMGLPAITKQELKRRLACIADLDQSMISETLIDILIHGLITGGK